MIFGVDLSKYQGDSAMDGLAFAVLNVEDPTFPDKARYAHDHGIVYDVYKWIYPGQSGGAMMQQAKRIVDAASVPGREPGYWADWEEAGVSPNQVGEWFAAGDTYSVRAGWYTYLYLLRQFGMVSNPFAGRPFWIAYYPGANDGSYPAGQEGDAHAYTSQLWQYSSGGGLDRDVVLDETWWAHWSSGAAPIPQPSKEASDMVILTVPGGRTVLVVGNLILRDFVGAPNPYGIPQDAVDYAADNVPVKIINGVELAIVDKVSKKLAA
jgi:Glycosyl hydrolases family 25